MSKLENFSRDWGLLLLTAKTFITKKKDVIYDQNVRNACISEISDFIYEAIKPL